MKLMTAAIFCVFLTLWLSDMFGIDLSLVPGLSVKNLMLYIVVGWIALEAFLDGSGGGFFHRHHEYMSLHVAFVALILVASLSVVVIVLFVDYPDYGIMKGIMLLKGFAIDHYLMLFVFLAGVSREKTAVWMLKAMLILFALGCFLSLADMFGVAPFRFMTPRGDGRLQGPLGGSNDYGAIMAFLLPLAFSFMYLSPGRGRFGWLLVMLVFLVTLLFSVSRGGVVALIGGAVAGSVLFRRYIPARRIFLAGALFVGLSVVALAVLAPEHGDLLYERFIETSTTGYAWDQSSGRTQIWSDGLMLMSDKPVTLLIGFGWKTYELLIGIASHNEYLGYFFELGLIGLSLAFSIYFSVIFQLSRALQSANDDKRVILLGFLFGFLAVLVALLFGNLYKIWLFIWAITGLVLRLAASDSTRAQEQEPIPGQLPPISPRRESA